jgi:hypothetical protein
MQWQSPGLSQVASGRRGASADSTRRSFNDLAAAQAFVPAMTATQ